MRRLSGSRDSTRWVAASASMRKALSTTAMRLLEERGEKIGITKLLMMENAGAAIARYIHNQFGTTERPKRRGRMLRMTVVAGTGNNGGDAFVAARHLVYWGTEYNVSVVLIGDESKIRTIEAATNWEIICRIPAIRRVSILNLKDLKKLDGELKHSNLIISAIFGTGFRGRPRKLQELAISKINKNSGAFKLSVDVPSGMEADTGKARYAVRSDVTISMHAPKSGMLKTQTARQKCGEVITENIGLPFHS